MNLMIHGQCDFRYNFFRIKKQCEAKFLTKDEVKSRICDEWIIIYKNKLKNQQR